MKKFKFIMPILALLCAFATAFATAKISVHGNGFYKDINGGQCVVGYSDQEEDCVPGSTYNCTINGIGPIYDSLMDCESQVNVLKFDVY